MGPLEYFALASIALLFLLGTPLTVAFSLGSILILIKTVGLPVGNLAQLFFAAINSYTLLAMPFFILAGNIILRCDGISHLRDFLNRMVGNFPGGMAAAIIIFAAFLGSVSGSATACLAIIGTIFVPMMVNSGYSRAFASGLTVTSSGLGAVIPPSIFFIVFGSANRIPIADLFMGGVGPGFLAAFLMIVTAIIISRKRGYKSVIQATNAERLESFKKSFPIILMPLIVLGGIYSGQFSPTQAAAVSVFYSLFAARVIYKNFSWKDFVGALVDTTRLSSMIYFLVVGGELFGKVLGYVGLPQMIAQWVIDMNLGPIGFLLMAQVLLLVMGFFFSSFPMVIIVLPLFLPSVYSLGIDPVLYGALAIFCSIIGEVTPPMGPQLWIAAPICGERIGNIMKESWVFLGVQVFALFLTTIFPSISLFLVNLTR